MKKVLKIFLGIFILALIYIAICFGLILSKVNDRPAHLANKYDSILVLGSFIEPNKQPATITKNRLNAALKIAKVNPKSKIIISGGKGSDEPVAEATAMANYLETKGISKQRIIEENKASDTSQNLSFSKKYLKGRTVIVTSDFHLYRALYLARKLDVKSAGYAAHTTIHKPLLFTGYYGHEVLGLTYAFVFGAG
ncbi:YdcF family protein [Lactococcus nasutitermitis]|uniref:YdcF family protein n=1 Tax=Lactococcus nasutitermitis TaxID=1652957 RepID=A0ABV9JB56_9LACT|nr:YdcF family protein [Lactococcus nasutitermitis]